MRISPWSVGSSIIIFACLHSCTALLCPKHQTFIRAGVNGRNFPFNSGGRVRHTESMPLRTATASIPLSDASSWTTSNAKERYTGERREIFLWRSVFLALAACCALNLPSLDRGVVALWEMVSQKAWFRHDMFEPVLSVASFFAWVHGWFLFDTLLSWGTNTKNPISRGRLGQWLRQQRLKYRLQDRAFASTASGFASKKNGLISESLPMVEQNAPLPKMNRWYASWYWETFVYLAPLWAIATYTNIFAPRRRALAWAAPTFLTVAGQILGGLFLYDFFFFFGHVLVHKLHPRIYRMTHGKHHINAEVRASDTVRLTVPEEIIDVVCSITALRLLRAHPLSRALYDMIITFLLVELHCGYDMPWSPQNLLPQVFAGSRRHHLHHKNGNQYFQKFFKYFDDGLALVSRRPQLV